MGTACTTAWVWAWHLAMCLLCLSSARTSSSRISPNLESWKYDHAHGPLHLNMSHTPGAPEPSRVWTREQLDLALKVHNTSLHTLARLISKLNEGQPITVVAIGTSVTAEYGGCFFAGPYQELLSRYSKDVQPLWNHTEYGNHMKQDLLQQYCTPTSWGSRLMQLINTTWPHPGHTFINAGQSASSLHTYINAPCLREQMAEPADLVIIEMLNNNRGERAEQLISKILHWYDWDPHRAPAFIWLQSIFMLDRLTQKESLKCVQDPSLCDTLCGGRFQHEVYGTRNKTDKTAHSKFVDNYESEVERVCHHYGIPVVSYRAFLTAGLDAGRHKQQGMSECRWLAQFNGDDVHPSRDGGKLLFAEMLFNVLYHAEKWAEAHPELAQQPVKLPPRPLYGFARKVLRTTQSCAPDTSTLGLPGAVALRTEGRPGWQYTEYQEDVSSTTGAPRKHKPGWYSKEPGSALIITLPTQFNGTHRNDSAKLVLTHLISYEHMGQASVECVKGCECRPSIIEGNHKSPSVPHEHIVHVTEHPACEVKVTVLNSTTSGQHKVKLISVAAMCFC